MAWGFWRLPEHRLRLLGPTSRRRILELGCGAARWSIALAKAGARPVGLDLSSAQLRIARRLVRSAQVDVPLLEGSAESIPLRDRTMDLVFCDWGAMTFADPLRTVPECARVLRPGGRLVFATLSPLSALFRDTRRDRIAARPVREYFGLRRLDFGDEVNFVLPYGEWVRLFSENGLVVEALIEPRPPEGTTTPYLNKRESNWGRRWPLETIWRLRKIRGRGHPAATSVSSR